MNSFRRMGLCFLLLIFILFFSCSRSSKFDQYYSQGQLVYEKSCANCHQKNGEGLGLVYPPLASSDFIDQYFERTLCLMKYGIKGELTVNGKSFNKSMPGVLSLTELEIAELATYIYNSWGHERGIVAIEKVRPPLANCEGK